MNGYDMDPVPETAQVLDDLIRQGKPGLALRLYAMADRAREIVPECVGLSLTLLDGDHTFTLVASNEVIAQLDAMQYLDGGPCPTSVDRVEVIDAEVADLLDEGRWSLFARSSAHAGVGSTLSLPLLLDGKVVGGVNLYAATPQAFDGRHDSMARALGASAAHAVADADLSFRTRVQAAETRDRWVAGADVEVALGIIMVRYGVDESGARDRLEHAADRAGITPAQVARALKHLSDDDV